MAVETNSLLLDPWVRCRFHDDGTANEVFWQHKNGKSPDQWDRVVGTHIVQTPGRESYVELTVETFELKQGADIKTKGAIALRCRTVGRALDGSPILPLRRTPAVEFVRDYRPDPQKISASEYESILDELKPVLARERAARERELSSFADRAEQAERASQAAINPAGTMAAMITEAVVKVLTSQKGAA